MNGTGFTGDIRNFMKESRVQLAYSGSQGQQAPIDMCTPGPVPRTLHFPEGVRFELALTGTRGGARTIMLTQTKGTFDNGVRYLPWKPDRCTFTRMDPAARLVFTGPLTGCNIYVAGPVTSPVLFHANSNTNAGDAAANNADKLGMVTALLGANVCGLLPNTPIAGKLERHEYSSTYLGFVFGYQDNDVWSFYFSGLGKDSQLLRRMT